MEMPEHHPYTPVLILIAMASTIAALILLLAHAVGPRRHGPVKDDTYESGMPPVGDARRRFNVRFYLIAVLFLLFDVEVVFLWPWARLLADAASATPSPAASQMLTDGYGKEFLLAMMGVFSVFLVIGFVYEWRKGILRWS